MEKTNIFTGLQHIGVPTGNVDETIAFYQTFGFEVEWSKGTAPEEKVAFLKCGSFVIETYYSASPALAAGAIDHMAMDVTDIDAAFEYAASKGYPSIEGQITFLPFFEHGVKFFTILGPNKEKLEFNQKL